MIRAIIVAWHAWRLECALAKAKRTMRMTTPEVLALAHSRPQAARHVTTCTCPECQERFRRELIREGVEP